jgi:UDP-glucose 4-epimerase
VKDSAPIRDYVYIKDLVSVLRKFHDCNLEFETFNVGTGIGHSVQDVNDIIQSVWGVKKVLVNLNLPRDNEISVSVANINKISSELGWKPSYSLHDGLREMYESDC